MEDWLHKKLKIEAAKQDCTINDIANQSIKMYLHNLCKNTNDGNTL